MIDGPWEMSGPEEDDKVDESVFVCHTDFDGYEVIEIVEGTVKQRKQIGRRIAELLNKSKARLTQTTEVFRHPPDRDLAHKHEQD